jgi:hypothetical protein
MPATPEHDSGRNSDGYEEIVVDHGIALAQIVGQVGVSTSAVSKSADLFQLFNDIPRCPSARIITTTLFGHASKHGTSAEFHCGVVLAS